ncbi:MAG TPA: c-type cytochrome [Steroidobacteraceae bacterium]|nr:c-type cytochrome [Steroidobacteraceae bacterium]
MSPITKVLWAGILLAGSSSFATEPAGVPPAGLGEGTPFVDGTVEAGAPKAAGCSACHGPNGNSINSQWPKLAGQNAVYLAEQLHLFKSGVRPNSIMLGMSVNLSESDIDSLAVFYQAQTPTGGEADAAMWKAGEILYRFGDPSREIPACSACHGPTGRGNTLADYPALRAQFADYVAKQLGDYAGGVRYGAAKSGAPVSRNGYIMETIAKRLNADDIKHLAAYIQGMR